jgi:hypothetical protein
MLRDFLYLDDKMVDQYLAQVEGGLYDDERELEADSSEGGVEGGLKAGPLTGGGKRGRTHSGEIERVRRQTPESRYNRLHDQLELLELNDSTTDVFGRLDARQMFVAECYVDIPSISRAIGATEELAGLADLMKAFAPAQMDKETDEAMRGLSQFSAMTGGDFVATGDLRDGEATLAFKLTPAGLRVPIGELEGDAIVVGRIQRKWPEGQSFPLLNVPGLNLMSREDRRRMEREKPADDKEGMYVNGPAASASVVAIFR